MANCFYHVLQNTWSGVIGHMDGVETWLQVAHKMGMSIPLDEPISSLIHWQAPVTRRPKWLSPHRISPSLLSSSFPPSSSSSSSSSTSASTGTTGAAPIIVDRSPHYSFLHLVVGSGIDHLTRLFIQKYGANIRTPLCTIHGVASPFFVHSYYTCITEVPMITRTNSRSILSALKELVDWDEKNRSSSSAAANMVPIQFERSSVPIDIDIEHRLKMTRLLIIRPDEAELEIGDMLTVQRLVPSMSPLWYWHLRSGDGRSIVEWLLTCHEATFEPLIAEVSDSSYHPSHVRPSNVPIIKRLNMNPLTCLFGASIAHINLLVKHGNFWHSFLSPTTVACSIH
jgi:hypothetical protein